MSALALKMTRDVIMGPNLDTAEFMSLSRMERVAKCREMAAEATRLAAAADRDMRNSYLELAKKWSELADEMESVSGE
jgi:hypothetical protein